MLKALADGLRWGLILGTWGIVAYVLWGIAWGWALLWAIPGFLILLNVFGFATLPLYVLIGRGEARRFRQALDEIGRRPPDAD